MLTIEKKRDLEQLQARKLEVLKRFNERVLEVRERGL
jgi:type II secretory pathway predicted ATPase ExeA